MPFTPFHFGAGAALHSLKPTRISFLAFCGANVVMDVEPLYYLLHGGRHIHRFLHTFVGAGVVTLITTAIGLGLLALSKRVSLPNYFRWQQLTWPPLAIGAFLGAYTHIVLDGMTHTDMTPLAPFSQGNPMLGWMNFWQVQLLCLALGAVGAGILYLRACASR